MTYWEGGSFYGLGLGSASYLEASLSILITVLYYCFGLSLPFLAQACHA